LAELKSLVVNADDFGFTRDVNQGIVEAYQKGILRATTLMANGEAFEDAVRLAHQNPGLDVGCHLVLVRGNSLADPARRLPASVAGLMGALALGRVRAYEELAAQVRKILWAGIRPTHLDTHKHTHLLPPVLEAVARISEEYAIPWVRRPFDLAVREAAAGAPWSTQAAERGLRLSCPRFHQALKRHGCRATDHFVGYQMTGRLCAANLVRLIHQLPHGSTELMCHPGFCGHELRRAHTRLKESRERELAALVAPEVQAALEEVHVRLVSFREL
jgi:predicted glycoside hydrolase/deacetylase ChbG (UPF0249 family)